MFSMFIPICVFVINLNYINCDPTITIPQGELFGKLELTKNGEKYYSYSGIPYAKPPVGDLRFKPPVRADLWEGILNATKTGNHCPSLNLFTNELEGDEDCLYLNIHVPENPKNLSLPVLFWIHEGGFVRGYGNADFQGTNYLLVSRDIILVTFNYRLGILGFLNLELEGALGNAGLKDQVEALKWTKENIAAFGGNPENITIAGRSAGAASVHYLLLSHMATGLFQKAMVLGGSAFNPWAFERNPIERAFELCDALDHAINSTQDALEFLKAMPVDKLLVAKLPSHGQLIDDFKFVPSIEKVLPNNHPFLEESPLDRMKSDNFNKVPLVIGFNKEGGLFYKIFEKAGRDSDCLNKLEADSEKSVPLDLQIPRESEVSKKLGEKIRKFYFGDQPVTENEQKFIELVGDLWFVRGIDKQVKLTVEKQTEPVYYYEYWNARESDDKKTDDDGLRNKSDANIELLMEEIMFEMWTNFIITGNPIPEVSDLLPVIWAPATKEKLNFLNIKVNLSMGTDPEGYRVKFWEDLASEY